MFLLRQGQGGKVYSSNNMEVGVHVLGAEDFLKLVLAAAGLYLHIVPNEVRGKRGRSFLKMYLSI